MHFCYNEKSLKVQEVHSIEKQIVVEIFVQVQKQTHVLVLPMEWPCLLDFDAVRGQLFPNEHRLAFSCLPIPQIVKLTLLLNNLFETFILFKEHGFILVARTLKESKYLIVEVDVFQMKSSIFQTVNFGKRTFN